MTPTTHTTRLSELLEKQQPTRIQTGVEPWNGGAIRGLMFAIVIEMAVVVIAYGFWFLRQLI